jgi:hypothetical protein
MVKRIILFFALVAITSRADFNPFPGGWSESWGKIPGDSLYIPGDQELIELCEAISERAKGTWCASRGFYGVGGRVDFPEMGWIRTNYFGIKGDESKWDYFTAEEYESGDAPKTLPRSELYDSILYAMHRLLQVYIPTTPTVQEHMNSDLETWDGRWWENGYLWRSYWNDEIPFEKNPLPPVLSIPTALETIGIDNATTFYTNTLSRQDKRIVTGIPIAPSNDIIIAEWQYLTHLLDPESIPEIEWTYNRASWVTNSIHAYNTGAHIHDDLMIYVETDPDGPPDESILVNPNLTATITYIYLDEQGDFVGWDQDLEDWAYSPTLLFSPWTYRSQAGIYPMKKETKQITLPWTTDKEIVGITEMIFDQATMTNGCKVVAVYSNCQVFGLSWSFDNDEDFESYLDGISSYAFNNPTYQSSHEYRDVNDSYFTWADYLLLKDLLTIMKGVVVSPKLNRGNTYLSDPYATIYWQASADPPPCSDYSTTLPMGQWLEDPVHDPDFYHGDYWGQYSVPVGNFDGLVTYGLWGRNQSFHYHNYGGTGINLQFRGETHGEAITFDGVYVHNAPQPQFDDQGIPEDGDWNNTPCTLQILYTDPYSTIDGSRAGADLGNPISFGKTFSCTPQWFIVKNSAYDIETPYYGTQDGPHIDYRQFIRVNANAISRRTCTDTPGGADISDPAYGAVFGLVAWIEYAFKFQ